ncbi:MAG: signal recognition particle-docking protein FtsY [Cellvibrionales bacterium]|nr:signal recognition particle-docking protein FtsY [Cellvibrionales bacterium]
MWGYLSFSKRFSRLKVIAYIVTFHRGKIMSESGTKKNSSSEKDVAIEPAKKKTFLQFFSREKIPESNPKRPPKDIRDENDDLVTKHLSEESQQTHDLNMQKGNVRNKFLSALTKTGLKINDFFQTEQRIDDQLLEKLEDRLILADVGIETTEDIIKELSGSFKNTKLVDRNTLYKTLQSILMQKLISAQKDLEIDYEESPFIILVVGINGVGKTTTIGKIAKYYSQKGKSIMLAAGDTYRAAAAEQLQDWGKINNIPVVSQREGSDSASVIFDAIESAKSNNIDILLADTAGRLHTKNYLMEELKKIKRVIRKINRLAPHEVLLVIDAGTGQNAINQLKEFHSSIAVTGLVLTKLDGTAKGGIIFSLIKKFNVPIRFVGLGENLDDLQPFDAELYVQALLDGSSNRNY